MNIMPKEFKRFPKHWKVLPFLDVVKDATSGNIKTPKNDYLSSGNIPIVDQGKSLFGGFTNTDKNKCNVNIPAIIFGDHTRVFKYIDRPFALGADGVKILEAKIENVDTRFLFYYFKQLNIESAGYSRHYKFLKETYIPLPPLEEQKCIAAILDKADALRQKRKQAIDLADEFLRSVFLDMFGDPVTNPKGWEIKELSELTSKVTDGTHKTPTYIESGVPFLSAKNIKPDGLNWSDTKFISEEEHRSLVKRCNPEIGDILLTKSGSLGTPAIVHDDRDFSLFESAALFKLKKELIEPLFILHYLKSEPTKYMLLKSTKGVAIKHLHLTDLRQLKIIYPPVYLREKFVGIANKTAKILSGMKIKNDSSEDLFKALSQKAFSGQL